MPGDARRRAGSVRAMALDPSLLDWLLDSDPALRWQVERDLAGAPPDVTAGAVAAGAVVSAIAAAASCARSAST